MTDAPSVHSYMVIRQGEAIILTIYKRLGTREVEQVALVSLNTPNTDPERIGPALCASFDELLTRCSGKPH